MGTVKKAKPLRKVRESYVDELTSRVEIDDHFWKDQVNGLVNDKKLCNHSLHYFGESIYQFQFISNKRFYFFCKRAMDIFGAIAAIMLFSPIIIAAASYIQFFTKDKSVLFRQIRVGKNGQLFYIYKFRTMAKEAVDPKVFKLRGKRGKVDHRITFWGKFLRNYKIDELPQLFNVLIGDMSLVGPRPFIIEESLENSKKYLLRHAVKPGMTGLWQVKFGSFVPVKYKMQLDCKYVMKCNLFLDLYLLICTIPAIFKGENWMLKKNNLKTKH